MTTLSSRIFYIKISQFIIAKRQLYLLFALLLLCLYACQKEYSYEGGVIENVSGTLACDTVRINGTYELNAVLKDSNYIYISVNVTTTGKYKIYTDTVNSLAFTDSGYFSQTGLQQVKLKPNGKFTAVESWVFTVHFVNEHCSLVVLPPLANYLLDVSGNDCSNHTVFGIYQAGVPASAADSVRIAVNVLSGGSYQIQTNSSNGFNYYASGIFTITGNQQIILHAKGTPLYGGVMTFPISAGTSSCAFPVSVNYKVADTSMYYYFEAEGKTFSGFVDSAYPSTQTLNANILHAISIQTIQTSDADTTFTLVFSRINTNITTGTYYSALLGDEDFECGMDYSAPQTYIYAASRYMPEFKFTLVNYDAPGNVVRGNFSGPVLSNRGDTVQISNGFIQSYLKH